MVRELAALSLFLGATCAVAHAQVVQPSTTLPVDGPTAFNPTAVRTGVYGDSIVSLLDFGDGWDVVIHERQPDGSWSESFEDSYFSQPLYPTWGSSSRLAVGRDLFVVASEFHYAQSAFGTGDPDDDYSWYAAIRVYERDANDDWLASGWLPSYNLWTDLATPPNPPNLFSKNGVVAVDTDGERVVRKLTTHLYDLTNGFWAIRVGVVVDERSTQGTWVPYRLALGSDAPTGVAVSGDTVAVGIASPGGPGSVRMFERNGDGSWSLAQTLVASDGETSDGFGANIDIEGVRMIVGASGHDEGADQDRGAAYVFERPPGSVGGGWVETAKLVRPNGAAQDFFGGGVAMSGDRVLVTANSADTHGTNFGAADVFERESDGSWRHAADLAGSAGCKRFGVDIDGSTAVGRGQISQPCGTSIDVYDLPSLVGFADTISLASGGSQPLLLQPGTAHGDELFFLFGSVTGTSPGYPVIGTPWTLPLVPDIYFEYTTWTLFGGGLLTAPFGLIHPYGSAHSEFVVPPNFPPVFAGLTVHHAYALLDVLAPGAPLSFVSTPSSVTLVP